MKHFNTAGISMLLSSIPVLMYASAALRAGSSLAAAMGIVAALAAIVAASVLCFRAVNDPALRRPATIACGVVFGVSALATLGVAVALVVQLVAPDPNGLPGPAFWIPALSIYLALVAPIAILSGVSLRLCLKTLHSKD